MAFTERYVTSAAAGGGAGTSGDPWTLTEGINSAVAGDRVNIQSDAAYSIGALTVTNQGNARQFIVFRGYDVTIGDLENQGRNADGTLNTTGFPAITLTGFLNPNRFSTFQNLAFTGALSSALLSSGTVDDVYIISCEMINTLNNASAQVFSIDNYCKLIDSDFECTGAAHGILVEVDTDPLIYGCRFKSVANGAITAIIGTFVGNVFIGDGSSVALNHESRGIHTILISNNTFYNWGTAIQLPNAAPTTIVAYVNNHVTDCGKYIDDLYVATASSAAIELNSRTRDNTTPRTGVGDGVLAGEVTTDTGGPETDYTNAGADDLSLIAGAPGVDTGLGFG